MDVARLIRSLPVNKVIVGDCIEVMAPWPADSVDLVVTSPPYWGLRDYGEETVKVWGGDPECEHEWNEYVFPKRGHPGDKSTLVGTQIAPLSKSIGGTTTNTCVKCGAWHGSLGLEPHPQLFIDHLTEICREIKRVLKPTGTFWLNLGDTYFGGKGKSANRWSEAHTDRDTLQREAWNLGRDKPQDMAQQDGAWLQPKQKLMIPARVAIALQHDGWILRNDIIWHKPNHMPSSVKDRLTCSYEHVFLFVKQKRYYFDLDKIRKPHSTSTLNRLKQDISSQYKTSKANEYYKHLPMLGGGSRKEIPQILQHMKENLNPKGKNPGDMWDIPTQPFPGAHFAVFPTSLIDPIIKAGCPQGGVVLDPFAGSGTALRVARKLGRRFIGIEVNPEYAAMAEERVRADKYKPAPPGVVKLTAFSKR